MAKLIYTIGHSTLAMEEFIHLLKLHSVDAVADVRSNPYSKYQPQFNRESLHRDLRGSGIDYVFLGAELGARSTDPNCYVDGRVQYDLLALAPGYIRGIDRLVTGSKSHTIAVMCSEKEPLECHRTVLVARSLIERSTDVSHILSNGAVEPHDDTLSRLLWQLDMPEDELFRTRSEILEEALKRQEQKIAYVDKDMKVMGEPA